MQMEFLTWQVGIGVVSKLDTLKLNNCMEMWFMCLVTNSILFSGADLLSPLMRIKIGVLFTTIRMMWV